MTVLPKTTQIATYSLMLPLVIGVEPEEVGQRIKLAREKRGWTQLRFATEIAHVSPGTVSRWERGQLPRVGELYRIAELLDVPIEELVGEDEPTSRGEDVREVLGELRDEVRELRREVRESRGDTPRQRRRAS